MLSQNRQALHDLISHAKVVELRTATIFDSIEEKESYDAKYLTELEFKKSKEYTFKYTKNKEEDEKINDADTGNIEDDEAKVIDNKK